MHATHANRKPANHQQDDVNRHAQRWLANVLSKPECRARAIRAMAVDADGSALLMCRYVAAAELPPALAQLASGGGGDPLPGISVLEGLMLKLARFVAYVSAGLACG